MKKLVYLSLTVVFSMTLAGCTFGTPANSVDKDNNPAIAQLIDTPSTPGGEVDPDNVDPDNVDPDNEKIDGIVNNDSNFVCVDGKVYFRQYSEGACLSPFAPSESLGHNMYGSNYIMVMDEGDPSSLAILSSGDQGSGPLYYRDGALYSYEYYYDDEFNAISDVYKVDVNTGAKTIIGTGYIKAFDKDSNSFVSCEYNPDDKRDYFWMYSDDKQENMFSLPADKYYASVIGINKDSMFLYVYDLSYDCHTIYQYDYKTDILSTVCDIPTGLTYEDLLIDFGEAKNGEITDDKVSFDLFFVTGAADYIDYAFHVESEYYHNATADTLNPAFTASVTQFEPDVQRLYGVSPELPSEIAYMFEFDQAENQGFTKNVQYFDEINGNYYVVTCDAHETPSWNKTEVDNYSLLSTYYYFVPAGASRPEELIYAPYYDSTVTARIWFDASGNGDPEKIYYNLVAINGVETAPDYDSYLYEADLLPTLVYEHPDEEDFSFENFLSDGIDEWFDDVSEYSKDLYWTKAPKKDASGCYEVPNSDKPFYQYYYVHIGFDPDGKVCYIRPVIFD